MSKKLRNHSKKFKVHKQLGLKLLPVAALILIAMGAVAFLLHPNNKDNSAQIIQTKPKPTVQTKTQSSASPESQSAPAAAPSSSVTYTTSSPAQPQDTCDEQAAADATAKAKAAHQYTIDNWHSSDPYYEDQYAQGKIIYDQLLAEKEKDSFTLESDLDWINQALAKTLASLGCPVSYPLF